MRFYGTNLKVKSGTHSQGDAASHVRNRKTEHLEELCFLHYLYQFITEIHLEVELI